MAARSEWVTRRPSPLLAPFIDRCVGYRMVGFPAGIHRGLPSRHLTLIVSIGPAIDVVIQTDAGQAPRSYRGVVGGLEASPAAISHRGTQEGIAVELTPLGSRAVLGAPARALWNTSLDLDEVIGPVGNELWERLQPAGAWTDRFAACDEILGGIIGNDVVAPQLRGSWRLLTASAGAAAVGDLATAVGWSRQHLTSRFGAEFGLSPKLAGRVLRFERARGMLRSTPSFVSIAQVAAACGYYDQAHLTRDFVDLAGCPPGRLCAEELPYFQDGSDSPGHDGRYE